MGVLGGVIRTKSRTALAGALACLVMARANPARAADPREDEAQTECLAGHLERGLQLLAELYVATGDPNHIYNQGRCFEQNGRLDEAISRFREYLRKAKHITPAEEADARRHIRDCELLRRPPSDQPPRSRPTPRAAVALLSVGAFSLLTGVSTGLGARALESSVQKQWSASGDRWGRRLEVVQWSAYVLGGLCLVGGAVVYLRPASDGSGGVVAWRDTF
ncbi:MAG TPA: hypothetical protein VN914_09395 [Polyangia bacterium]|nr:hypothetical protein [Polyangia bacterium]